MRSFGELQRAVTMRLLAFMCSVGATCVVLSTLASPLAWGTRLALIGVSLGALAMVVTVLHFQDRVDLGVIEAMHYLCTSVVALLVYLSGDPATPYALFFLWLAVHACYFLPPRRAAFELTLCATAYAGALVALGGSFPLARWAMLVSTTVVLGVVIQVLRARVRGLISSLSELARRDSLTGLLNRSGFDDAFEQALAGAARHGRSVGVLLADVDGFKEVNDRCGHYAGDRVLERIADTIRQTVRASDIVARIGGDEFALVLPDTATNTPCELAARLCEALGAEFADDAAPVTVSIGVARFPDHGASTQELLRAADETLYAAKARGGNHALARETNPVTRHAASLAGALIPA